MTKRNLKMSDIKPVVPAKRKGKTTGVRVQKFAQFQPESEHVRLDEMADETIYIVKIEPQTSDQYGEGYKLHFRMDPRKGELKTAACYGAYVVPVLDNMYNLSHLGKLISPEHPVEATIRKAGRTYRFE